MAESSSSSYSLPRPATFHSGAKSGRPFHVQNLKKRGHGNRSWIWIDKNGNSKTLALDKSTLMRRCHLPGRDLRLLDPLFVYPSTLLGREKAIVVNLESIRCIITADEVFLMNSLDGVAMQYEIELCRRLHLQTDRSDEDLPFEFKALELALELACMSLDAQVAQLELELYPVLDELAVSINSPNLEHVRRLKSILLTLTYRVQKIRDEIEHLMDDDGDMAEMYLTAKKERLEKFSITEQRFLEHTTDSSRITKSAPVSPVSSPKNNLKLRRSYSNWSTSKHGSAKSSSGSGEQIQELEMLLEAYFVVIDHALNKLLSLKEYIDDTEDFINIKLDNTRNQLIQFECLLTAATFVTAIFAAVTAVFGMNFTPAFLDVADNFNVVLTVSGISCGVIYSFFLLYFKHKRLLPL